MTSKLKAKLNASGLEWGFEDKNTFYVYADTISETRIIEAFIISPTVKVIKRELTNTGHRLTFSC